MWKNREKLREKIVKNWGKILKGEKSVSLIKCDKKVKKSWKIQNKQREKNEKEKKKGM